MEDRVCFGCGYKFDTYIEHIEISEYNRSGDTGGSFNVIKKSENSKIIGGNIYCCDCYLKYDKIYKERSIRDCDKYIKASDKKKEDLYEKYLNDIQKIDNKVNSLIILKDRLKEGAPLSKFTEDEVSEVMFDLLSYPLSREIKSVIKWEMS